MKFTLDSNKFTEFSRIIGLTTKVTGTKSPLIRIEVSSNSISVSGVGTIGKLSVVLPLNTDDQFQLGAVVVKEDFIRVIKALPISKGDSVTFSLSKTNSMLVKLSTGNSKYSVKCLAHETVPVIDFGQCQQIESLQQQDLLNGLNAKLFCKTDSETSSFFSTVKIGFSRNSLSFVGSDVSVVMNINFNRTFKSTFDVLVPHTVASVIQAILAVECKNLQLGITNTGHCIIKSDLFRYMFSTITSKYPDISGLLNLKSKDVVSVGNQDFLEKLLIINSLSNLKIASIAIKDDMIIKNTDTDVIQAEEVLPYSSNIEYNFNVMLKPLILYLTQIKSLNTKVLLSIDKFISIVATVNDVTYTLVTTPVIK